MRRIKTKGASNFKHSVLKLGENLHIFKNCSQKKKKKRRVSTWKRVWGDLSLREGKRLKHRSIWQLSKKWKTDKKLRIVW